MRFYNLLDSDNISKPETFFRPLNKTEKKVTISVSLLEQKQFFKKIVDTNGDYPQETMNKMAKSDLSNSYSWSVHEDEEIGGVRMREKYFVYWK